MKIVRSPRPAAGFLQVDNRVLRDDRISDRARGLLLRILSYPDGWETDSSRLSEGTKEGRDAIRAAIRELETAGYWVQSKTQGARGLWSTTAQVFDTPVDGWPADDTGAWKPVSGDPSSGANPQVAPTPGNPSSDGNPTPGNPSSVPPAETPDSGQIDTPAEAWKTDAGFSGATKKDGYEGRKTTDPSDLCVRDERADTHTGTGASKPKAAPKRATRLPDGFALDEGRRQYAINKGVPPVAVAEMFEHFTNHHGAKGSAFIDWNRAWMTWVQNSGRYGPPGGRGAVSVRGGPPSRPPVSAAAERQAALDDLERELRGEPPIPAGDVIEGVIIR